MKIIKIISFVSTAILLSGCSLIFSSEKMDLKEIHRDIPTTIVKKYNNSTCSYVDNGHTVSLPLLFVNNEHVSKIEEGFQAYGCTNWAFILKNKTYYSDFDTKGKLLSNGYSDKYLFGAFGTEKNKYGVERLTFLWIPFTTYEPPK